MDKVLKRKDIERLADRLFQEAGGLQGITKRILNFRNVAALPGTIHNYYYVNKQVYDYAMLNATLGQAVLCMAGGARAREAGDRYVRILDTLQDVGYLINYHFCDRAFDGYAMSLLVHSWMELRRTALFGEICDPAAARRIEDWFYTRAKQMWADRDGATWATFRPYDNQEIGIGICSLLSVLLAKRDPILAQGLAELTDSRIIGWAKKNGNLDDTLFYSPVFAKSMWYYAKYRQREDLLRSDNCRHTFESVLQQMPGSGMFTQYNWTQHGSAAEMMALGAYLFEDGRYQWMANRLLEDRLLHREERIAFAARNIDQDKLTATPDQDTELEEVILAELDCRGKFDHVWEGLTENIFHLWYFWRDDLQPVKPAEGSRVLYKSAGQGRWPYAPEPILPDKLVFRDGWENNSLFAIINLWGGQNSPSAKTVSHRYPAANELITLVWGSPFVVQNIDQVTRDIHIHRKDLNAFCLRENGHWLSAELIGELKFGVYPALDMMNAKLEAIHAFDNAAFSKSTLYEYRGWTNERTVVLVKGQALIVFDQCFGCAAGEGGVRWHLQGDMIDRQAASLRLRMLDSELSIGYPCASVGAVHPEITKNTRVIPISQHHADWDLDLIANAKRMGFVTLFSSDRSAEEATALPVTAAGKDAYPNAMAVALPSAAAGTRLSQYRDEYDYRVLSTDALIFMITTHGDTRLLSFCDATTITWDLEGGADVRFAGCSPSDWEICGSTLQLRSHTPVSGQVYVTAAVSGKLTAAFTPVSE
ncbi:MAG TPA: hypothetical protein PK537_09995 [Candidatus Limiplasma sp.]|nr:hypothetical protein [Candidatus Limiplasma sp.]HRX09102.1 hypothetical protein [Candidatus Limiplasma sp.]